MSETQVTPPGWYDDGSGHQRWWDGQQWGLYAPQPVVAVEPVRPPKNGMAPAGFVVGLIALLLCWLPFVNVIFIALGILISSFGLQAAKTRGRNGLASAGLILSIIAAFIAFLMLMLALQPSST